MGTPRQGIVEVGTEAAPIAMTANGGAGDVATWAHNQGVKARKVMLLDAVTRAPYANTPGVVPGANEGVVITQPDVNTIVATNLHNAPRNTILYVEFERFSGGEAGTIPATAVALS